MKLLKEIMRKQGVNTVGRTISREAVRGVILKGKSLLLVYSTNVGDYKFPGGGVDEGESYEYALVREIKEECGADVLSIIGELGKVIEYDMPVEADYDVFKRISYYYMCDVDSNFGRQSLDDYEKALGLIPVWVDIDMAIKENKVLMETDPCPGWVQRETYVLEYIKERFHL